MSKRAPVLLTLIVSLFIFNACKKKSDDPAPETNTPTNNNKKPSVNVTFPEEKTYAINTGRDTSWTIRAAASDGDGTITNVKFFVNGTYMGQDDTAPYELSHRFDLINGKNQKVTAMAFDNGGDSTLSAAVNVTFTSPLFISTAKFKVDNGAEITPNSINASRTTGGDVFIISLSASGGYPAVSLKISTTGTTGTITGYTTQAASYGRLELGTLAATEHFNSFYGNPPNTASSTFTITGLTSSTITGTFSYTAHTTDLANSKTVSGSFDVAY